MKDVEKIIQIFESGQYKLALELANGIKLNHLDLLQMIYDKNSAEVTDKYSDIYERHSSIFGDFEIVAPHEVRFEDNSYLCCRIIHDPITGDYLESIGYNTLQECFKTILYKIEVLY